MTNERRLSLPRGLALLRWLFLLATIIGFGQAVSSFQSQERTVWTSFHQYYYVVVLVLSSAACGSAWRKSKRLFVMLALGSQVVNAFVTGFNLLLCVFMLSYRRNPTLWNLVVLGLSVAVVAYLVRNHVGIRPDPLPER